jgi:hypothetical protein
VLEAGDDCVRISPPLTVSEEEMRAGIRIVTEAVAAVDANRPAVLRSADAIGVINEVEAAG